MSISLTKRNFLYQITLLTLIAGWVGAGILHYLLPGHYFGGYPFIPVSVSYTHLTLPTILLV